METFEACRATTAAPWKEVLLVEYCHSAAKVFCHPGVQLCGERALSLLHRSLMRPPTELQNRCAAWGVCVAVGRQERKCPSGS